MIPNLPRPATLENAHWFAESARIMAIEGWDIRLDDTPESLAKVDVVTEIDARQ